MDNVPGAGSTLGVGRLSKMPAGGYAIGFGHTGSLGIGPSLYKNVGYAPIRDLTTIARLCDYVDLLVVNANSPCGTLDDLLVAARAKPGALTYGSAGIEVARAIGADVALWGPPIKSLALHVE